nr:hypothetical protein [uncultured Bacillus sp.]
MNIRQYYEQRAATSLNAGLAALIPPILILFYSIVVAQYFQLLILVIPFLIYSLYCYQGYLLNRRRSFSAHKATIENKVEDSHLLVESDILLAFLPAPSLRILLFNPFGVKIGELRDHSFFLLRWFVPFFIDRFFNRTFSLYDQQKQQLYLYQLHKERLEIFTADNVLLYTIYIERTRKRKEFFLEDVSVILKKNGIPACFSFETIEKKELGRIQSGVMPVEWGKRFADPNTPILSFPESTEIKERIQLFALLIVIYMYSDH